MKVKVRTKKRDGYIVNLQVTVPLEEFKPAIEKATQKINQRARIPGFRQGKAPANILENYVGTEYLLSQAADEILEESYITAVEKLKLVPVDSPEIDVKTLEKDKDLVYDVVVVVKPDVELGEYKNLEIECKVLEPGDEDVDKSIEEMRKRIGTVETLPEDAAAEMGDEVNINYEGFCEGEAFKGGKGDNHDLTLGSNAFIPGFEDQLVGRKTGEDVAVDVTFPDPYHSAELAGKDAVFMVHINAIKRHHLPELNDDFAKDMSENCETMEDFRAMVRADLLKEAENRAMSIAKRDAIQKAIDNAKVDLPPIMVDNRLKQMNQEFEERLKYQGMTMERFLQLSKTTIQEINAKNRPSAELAAKRDLVLEAIAEAEGIKATQEEIDHDLEELAKSYKQDVEEVRKMLTLSGDIKYFDYSIKLKKASDFIVETAVINK